MSTARVDVPVLRRRHIRPVGRVIGAETELLVDGEARQRLEPDLQRLAEQGSDARITRWKRADLVHNGRVARVVPALEVATGTPLSSREEYLAKLDKVLSAPPSAAETRRRLDRVASEGWDARIREVVEVVERHLEPAARPAPPFAPAAVV